MGKDFAFPEIVLAEVARRASRHQERTVLCGRAEILDRVGTVNDEDVVSGYCRALRRSESVVGQIVRCVRATEQIED
jgi:hypothetical protein